MSPEQIARQQIDALLVLCGWAVQDYKKLNLSAGRGVAVREVPLQGGTADYLLFIDRMPVGVVEAKRAGVTLSSIAEQSGYYADNLPGPLRGQIVGTLPFLYESTGVETFFRDERDPHPRSRRVFAFHRPEIEQQFTRLEAGVTALRQVQAKLKRYRAAVLKSRTARCCVRQRGPVLRCWSPWTAIWSTSRTSRGRRSRLSPSVRLRIAWKTRVR